MYKDKLGFTIYLEDNSNLERKINRKVGRSWVLDKDGRVIERDKDLMYILSLYAIALIKGCSEKGVITDMPTYLIYVKRMVEDVLKYVEKNKLPICTKYE